MIYATDMLSVPMNREPDPKNGHQFGPWQQTTVACASDDRFGKFRKCTGCGAREVFAGGAGSHYFDDALLMPCEVVGSPEGASLPSRWSPRGALYDSLNGPLATLLAEARGAPGSWANLVVGLAACGSCGALLVEASIAGHRQGLSASGSSSSGSRFFAGLGVCCATCSDKVEELDRTVRMALDEEPEKEATR